MTISDFYPVDPVFISYSIGGLNLMITEIVPGLFQLKISFPRNPLRDCNIYLVKGRDKNLIVDTGIDIPESRAELLSDLKTLVVDLKKTEFFLTHMHVDHTGNVSALADNASTVYFSRPDAAILDYNLPQNRESRAGASVRNGFPPGDMTKGGPLERQTHPMRDFAVARNFEFKYIADGQTIKIGDFNFRCIWTPGHTKGHVCLYEPERKILLSGDHVLQDITPNISTWRLDENPLDDYLSSLDKIYNLEVKTVLPGHRRTMTDLRARIDELRHHHDVRAAEALSILKKDGKMTGYEVAARMRWDVRERTWDDLPIWQKMFAVGESLAHLRFLVVEGKVFQESYEGKILYFAK
jgi:glyoxylase-like metal-dependent hydrolase (beta-lactamase superfamily II)